MRFLNDPRFREARFGACLLGLLSFSLLAGCGGGGGGSNGNSGGGTTTTTGTSTSGTSTSGTSTGTLSNLTSSVTTSTGLTASITEASSTVSVGGTLVYTLTLTNNTANALPVAYTGTTLPTPSVALKIVGPNGVAPVQPVPGGPPLNTELLSPGQSISTTQAVAGFTTAGAYTATATFSDGTSVPPTPGPVTVTAQ